MVRPRKDPALRMSLDIRIPVTAEQKELIYRAAAAEKSEVASWARAILLKAGQKIMDKENKPKK